MNQPDYKATLQNITEVFLLNNTLDYSAILNASRNYLSLLASITGLDLTDPKIADKITAAGRALGPRGAAECLIELMRNYRFIRGIYKAVLAAQKRWPGERIHILYAGCGPFAPLVLPLTLVLPSDAVKFTVLDIFPENIDMVKKVAETFEVEPYFEDYVCADATAYTVPASNKPHILLTETMQRALKQEPQVSISLHLLPQCRENALIVPASITVSAGLYNLKFDTDNIVSGGSRKSSIAKLKDLMVFDQAFIANATRLNGDLFEPIEVSLPAELILAKRHLALFTVIQVFDDELLEDFTCSLTSPYKLQELQNEQQTDPPPSTAVFQYKLGSNPGFVYELMG